MTSPNIGLFWVGLVGVMLVSLETSLVLRKFAHLEAEAKPKQASPPPAAETVQPPSSPASEMAAAPAATDHPATPQS
jgi:hypothetical protein